MGVTTASLRDEGMKGQWWRVGRFWLMTEDRMGSKMQVEEFMEAMILDRSAWEIGESLERGGVIRGGEEKDMGRGHC